MGKEIFVERNIMNNSYRIWVREQEIRSTTNINYNSQTGYLELTTYEGCHKEGLKPFIELPTDVFKLLVKGIVEYNEKSGIHTERQDAKEGKLDAIEGKLDAKELHLKDLQSTQERLLSLLNKAIK